VVLNNISLTFEKDKIIIIATHVHNEQKQIEIDEIINIEEGFL